MQIVEMRAALGKALRARLALAIMLAFAMFLLSPSQAQERWPERPVTFVVPYPPGGTSDIVARIVGERLGEALGQAVVIENRPGANGNIGANIVAKSKPDGYTFLLCDVSALAVSPFVYRSLAFDPAKDLTGVAMLTFSPFLLVANPGLRADSLASLVEKSKAKDADFSFAATSIGSISHLTGLEIKQKTGARWQDVFYKGGAEAITDTIAGHTQLLIAGIPVLAPHIKSGKLTAIGVTSGSRLPLLPDIPSLSESGLTGIEVGAWQGIFAPAKTREDIVLRLNAEVARILASPETQRKFSEIGADGKPMPVRQVNAFMKQEADKWSSVIKQAHLSF